MSHAEPPEKVFASFMMGGFESATHMNKSHVRLDMIASTQHDTQAATDYALVNEVGLKTVRDGTRWHLIETSPGVYDFSSLDSIADAALDNDIQVIWNLMHYGWPDDLDIFGDDFVPRFRAYSSAVARHLRDKAIAAGKDNTPFYAPVNEISYLAWGATDGQLMYPHAAGRGVELKEILVRAAIAAMDAVWEVDPRARFIHVDPLLSIMHPRGIEHHLDEAKVFHDTQYEAWDMLAGMAQPELGGHPKYLDIIGVNFYHINQWEHPVGNVLCWATRPRDDRWRRFSEIVPELYHRYKRPFILSETSHVGVGRAEWLQEITIDVLLLKKRHIPIMGVCLYPIIDRTDWDDPEHWHNSGLWDYEIQSDGHLKRVIVKDYAHQIKCTQELVEEPLTLA
ncbi:MAG: beta-galactosidase [Alphaproteobacteria bacterium]|nr:beta-galactosidase [Alphaproteobacteria bacterium]